MKPDIIYDEKEEQAMLLLMPHWQKNLLRDLMEEGLSRSAAALKYGMSVYKLEKNLMKLWADYQSGNWGDK